MSSRPTLGYMWRCSQPRAGHDLQSPTQFAADERRHAYANNCKHCKVTRLVKKVAPAPVLPDDMYGVACTRLYKAMEGMPEMRSWADYSTALEQAARGIERLRAELDILAARWKR